MLITWLIGAFIAGALVGAFFDEIIEWAKDLFDSLSSYVKKAWVYIRRVPGGIKKMLEYVSNGRMVRETEVEEVSWEEIEQRHREGYIDDETFNKLKADREAKIAEINRDR